MSATGQRRDPFPVYCFRVEIDQIDGAAAFFRKVSGLKSESEVVDILEGGQNEFTYRLVGPTKWANLIFERGFSRSDALSQWREEWLFGSKQRRNGRIIQLDTKLNPVCTWWFKDGWPCKWELSEFDASKSELNMETLEIAHHGLFCESSKSGAASAPAAGKRLPPSNPKPSVAGNQAAAPVATQQKSSAAQTGDAGNQAQPPDPTLQAHYIAAEEHGDFYQSKLNDSASLTPQQIQSYQNRVKEANGEKAAAEYMEKNYPDHRMKFGFKAGPGIDQVWVKENAQGDIEEIIIVEAKGTPTAGLNKTKRGMQMGKRWLVYKAKYMKNSGDPERIKVGTKIHQAMRRGPPPTLTGKVIYATNGGGSEVWPEEDVPDRGIYHRVRKT